MPKLLPALALALPLLTGCSTPPPAEPVPETPRVTFTAAPFRVGERFEEVFWTRSVTRIVDSAATLKIGGFARTVTIRALDLKGAVSGFHVAFSSFDDWVYPDEEGWPRELAAGSYEVRRRLGARYEIEAVDTHTQEALRPNGDGRKLGVLSDCAEELRAAPKQGFRALGGQQLALGAEVPFPRAALRRAKHLWLDKRFDFPVRRMTFRGEREVRGVRCGVFEVEVRGASNQHDAGTRAQVALNGEALVRLDGARLVELRLTSRFRFLEDDGTPSASIAAGDLRCELRAR